MIRPRLLGKLTLLALGVSLIPLSIVGYFSYRIGQAAVRAAVDESQLQLGRQVAQHVSTELDHLLETLRIDARVLDVPHTPDQAPTPEGIAKFLQLVYHQSDAFAAVGLYDDHARPIGEPAYLDTPEKYPSLRGHEAMHAAEVSSLAQMAPIAEALARGAGVGPVFLGGAPQMLAPHVVLAVAFTARTGTERRVLAAEVTLRSLIAHVESLSTDDTEVKLLDGHARLVGGSAQPASAGRFHPRPHRGAPSGPYRPPRASVNIAAGAVLSLAHSSRRPPMPSA